MHIGPSLKEIWITTNDQNRFIFRHKPVVGILRAQRASEVSVIQYFVIIIMGRSLSRKMFYISSVFGIMILNKFFFLFGMPAYEHKLTKLLRG